MELHITPVQPADADTDVAYNLRYTFDRLYVMSAALRGGCIEDAADAKIVGEMISDILVDYLDPVIEKLKKDQSTKEERNIEQNTINIVYDRLDELCKAFDNYISKATASQKKAETVAALLEGIIHTLQDKE